MGWTEYAIRWVCDSVENNETYSSFVFFKRWLRWRMKIIRGKDIIQGGWFYTITFNMSVLIVV